MTLRKKLILSFILLVLILGSVIGYFSYQDAKELVLQSKEKEMADTINRIDISLNNWVDQVTTLAENIKENPVQVGTQSFYVSLDDPTAERPF